MTSKRSAKGAAQKAAGKVSRFQKGPDFKLVWHDESAIRPELLETFDYEYTGKPTDVTIETDEFTSVCPWSGLPDFANIAVVYQPHKKVIELRSFKYYLYTYRNVGIFQEHLTQRLLADLVKCCRPRYMKVVTDYNIRGGIHTLAEAEYKIREK